MPIPSEHTVFIVDDDEFVGDSLKALLECAGMVVEVYGSAREFLDACASPRSGCLVLDHHMSGMSGLELLQTLAANNNDIPVILMTGCSDANTKSRAMQAGAVALLEKPFEDQLLLETIERALERQRRSFRDGK